MPLPKTIYFDESGFTGYNLLDKDQPVFTVASTDVDEATAEAILRQSFPRYRGAEFKFTNIWRSGAREGLVNFGTRIGGLSDRVFVWMMDKRFAVLTKMVDLLIEPYVTAGGYDFYSDGFCWKYANYIHYGLTEFHPAEVMDRLLADYQAFSRAPSREALDSLRSQLGVMARSIGKPGQLFVEQMETGASLFERFHSLEDYKSTSELQLTSMLALVGRWRQRHHEDFRVVHDASANFFRRREMWDRITNSGVPGQIFPIGDGSFVEFPLRVVSTAGVNSAACFSIQLVDVVAGLASKYFDPRIEGEEKALFDRALAAGLGELTFNGVRPAPVFPDQIPPKKLSGPDAVDKMTSIIFGAHNGGVAGG